MTTHSRLTRHHLSLAALALAASAAAGSAAAANATATSTSTVVTPITITKAVDLSFGAFAASGTAGSVTLSPNGTRAVAGGVTAAGGSPAAARFDVAGMSGLNYSISVTGSATLSDGTNNMAFTPISDTSASAITTGDATSGTLTGGAQSIYVGGVLTVGASQPAGTYTGTLSATVEYN